MTVFVLAVLLCSDAVFASTVIPKPRPRPRPQSAQAALEKEEKQFNIDERFQELVKEYPDILPASTDVSSVKWVTASGEVQIPVEQQLLDDEEELTPEEIREIQRAQQWLDVQEDLTLRQIDERALELVQEFAKAKASNVIQPMHGQNGAVTFAYGSVIPRIVCRPNRVTDIALQAGEKVNAVHAGDTVRWQISPAKSGAAGAEVIHVVIKPLMPDISTNLLVMTDRRTYNLDLISSNSEYIPSICFSYPQDVASEWEAFIAANRAAQKKETTLEASYAMSAENLFFGYKVSGKVDWKPVRVFDDGTKTYIQMPKKYRALEAPVVLFYEGKQQKLVNYRVKGELYIIDRLMSRKAVMIAGKSKVLITRER